MTDLGSKKPLQLAHFGYEDAKILGTKVWGGSLDFNIIKMSKMIKIIKMIKKIKIIKIIKTIKMIKIIKMIKAINQWENK